MPRGGREKTNETPERRCILTGVTAPAETLIRFAVSPDGEIVADILGRLPGRGIWLSPGPDHIARAAKRGHFARAARANVRIPDGLHETVESQLAARVVSLLSLARKSGEAVAGFEKTRAALGSDGIAALIQASDGSTRGMTKLRPPPGGGHITCLTSEEIGMAFGRGHVIHAALNTGGLASRIRTEASRLAALRGTIPPPLPPA